MKILLVSLFGSSLSGRVGKIAAMTFGGDHCVIVSSDFNHGKKEYFSELEDKLPIKIERLHVPSYRKNLSFKRIYSHLKFAQSLKTYLNGLSERPDLIYCAMPSSSAAYIAGRYCKKHDIPFVIDVIDLWPDSLIPIVPFKKAINLCLLPWRWITHKAYCMADYISGESIRYAEVAHKINFNVPYSHTYIGVDTESIKKMVSESEVSLEKLDGEIWIGYGGSLGFSYDFDVILNGLKCLNESNVKYKMWFIGDGEKAEYIRNYSSRYNLNVEITGRLEYKDLLKYLSYCDIAINSFKEGTLVVHSYKFNDYVAAGCYILNNLPGETAEMVEKYNVGRNFSTSTFCNVLNETITNWIDIKRNLAECIEQLIEKELDTNIIYSRLKKNISDSIFND